MESKTQLEARVLGYVDQVRAGHRIEDDLVECKRTWPDTGKAKQIAGLANKANGEPFLIIVGIDEKAGAIVSPGNLDPANWWAGIRGKFDQDIWPDLAWHIGVVVDEEGTQVVALLFTSDRAPYVVKTEGGGSPEREVPIRDGTTTRSATRRELIRLLAPAVKRPSITIISASASCIWNAERPATEHKKHHDPELIEIRANVAFYIEHTATDQVSVLPEHLIRTELQFDQDWFATLTSNLFEDSKEERLSQSPWGVWIQRQQIICSASGPAALHAGAQFDPSIRARIDPSASVSLRLSVGVAGTEHPVVTEAKLQPREPDRYPILEWRRELGAWGFDISESDQSG